MNDWFCRCRTLEEARLEYRRLCFEHHPDHGGDTLVMQAINEAYVRFKAEHPSIRSNRRSAWQRAPRQRPTDVPPYDASGQSAPEPQPKHSRDYIHHIWTSTPWQQLANGNLARTLWDHTALLVRHPAPKYQGAWFVMLDNTFSPYFYDNRREAERAAFDLLYDKVKYREL